MPASAPLGPPPSRVVFAGVQISSRSLLSIGFPPASFYCFLPLPSHRCRLSLHHQPTSLFQLQKHIYLGCSLHQATIPFLCTMSWLRRLSRDRSSSKNDHDFPMPNRPNSFADHQSPPYKDTQYASTYNSQDRLQNYRPTTAPSQDPQQYNALPIQRPQESSNNATGIDPLLQMTAPDPLTRAFNEAVKPYIEKIERLQAEIEDKTLDIQQLEDERADMHAWIDKRGLRAGMSTSCSDLSSRRPSD